MDEARLVVTGACGYIGSVLSKFLPKTNLKLIDRLDFGVAGLNAWGDVPIIQGDFTHLHIGNRGLVHLASPRLSYEGGFDKYVQTSKRLFATSESKIIFASSCSVYGKNKSICDEETIPDPQDEYAKAKLELETSVLEKNGTVLRFATAYGDSKVPRMDLMVNQFVALAKTKSGIEVFNPEALRPFVNVMDIARSIVWAISAPPGVYNIGGENWTKRGIAKEISSMTGCKITEKSQGDPRDYAVCFAKAQVNGFHAYWTLEHWLQEKFNA